MSQSKTKIENKTVAWESRLRFRVGESCTYNLVTWVNLTGGNSEPGVGVDWLNVGSTEVIELINNLTSIVDGKALNSLQGPVIKSLIDANTALFTDYILLSEKGAANGVAILDINGKLIDSQYGDLAITDTLTPTETTLAAFMANNAAYTFQKGDIIILDDGSGNLSHYLYKSGTKTLEASYSLLNATKIPISAVIGLQGILDGKVNVDGEKVLSDVNFSTAKDAKLASLVPVTNIKWQYTATAAGANQVIDLPDDYSFIDSVQGLNSIYITEYDEFDPADTLLANQIRIVPSIEIGEIIEIHYKTGAAYVSDASLANGVVAIGSEAAVSGDKVNTFSMLEKGNLFNIPG